MIRILSVLSFFYCHDISLGYITWFVDYNTLHNEIEYLKSVWQRNSFPLFFIDSCIKKFLDKLFISSRPSNNVLDKKEIFRCLE